MAMIPERSTIEQAHENDHVTLYRQKAEESRAIAETMHSKSARETVLEVSAAWDRLADEEEKRREKERPRLA